MSYVELGLLCGANHTTLYIKPSVSTCPANETCFKFSQLAKLSHTLRNSNDEVLFFMDGNHVLNFQLIIINVTTIDIKYSYTDFLVFRFSKLCNCNVHVQIVHMHCSCKYIIYYAVHSIRIHVAIWII